jgi:hypothetical protein
VGVEDDALWKSSIERNFPTELANGGAVEMTGCGKHGKTIKLFSHPSPSPWKSLRDSHITHGHGGDGIFKILI